MNSISRMRENKDGESIRLVQWHCSTDIWNTRLNVNLVTKSTTQVLCDTGGGTCSSRSASKYFNGT